MPITSAGSRTPRPTIASGVDVSILQVDLSGASARGARQVGWVDEPLELRRYTSQLVERSADLTAELRQALARLIRHQAAHLRSS